MDNIRATGCILEKRTRLGGNEFKVVLSIDFPLVATFSSSIKRELPRRSFDFQRTFECTLFSKLSNEVQSEAKDPFSLSPSLTIFRFESKRRIQKFQSSRKCNRLM